MLELMVVAIIAAMGGDGERVGGINHDQTHLTLAVVLFSCTRTKDRHTGRLSNERTRTRDRAVSDEERFLISNTFFSCAENLIYTGRITRWPLITLMLHAHTRLCDNTNNNYNRPWMVHGTWRIGDDPRGAVKNEKKKDLTKSGWTCSSWSWVERNFRWGGGGGNNNNKRQTI